MIAGCFEIVFAYCK